MFQPIGESKRIKLKTYHRNKDILHVKQLLGHKSIQNTMLYTQLVSFEDDSFICRTAGTVEEAKELIKAGFEHGTHRDGVETSRKLR